MDFGFILFYRKEVKMKSGLISKMHCSLSPFYVFGLSDIFLVFSPVLLIYYRVNPKIKSLNLVADTRKAKYL